MRKPNPMAAFMLGAAFLMAASGASPQAQQFSADLLKTDAGSSEPRLSGKLNVSDGKVRMEISDVPAGYFLVLGDAAYFLRPAARMFMDAKQSSLLTRIFVPVNPDDPCRQWQAAAKIAGADAPGAEWRCERTGDDTARGVRTIRYRAFFSARRPYVSWIDPQLRFPIRLQMDNGVVVDVANIREMPQPDSLFAVPEGYRRFDPRELVERIKQSDVWVEPSQ